MTPEEEKALELINKFKNKVNPRIIIQYNKTLCIECFAKLHPNLYVSNIDTMGVI